MAELFELSYRPLNQADGSAEFSFNGYKVLAAVNGPLEASKRDELAEEAALEVVVRPAAGLPGALVVTSTAYNY